MELRIQTCILAEQKIWRTFQNKVIMISDYVIYLVCGIGLLLIARILYVYGKALEDFRKEHPEIAEKERHEKAIKSALRKRRKQIESEAFRKYPGIGGNYLKRRDYIKRKWRKDWR